MHRLGLKVWSTNQAYVEQAQEFYQKGFFSHIEIYVVPGTYETSLAYWRTVHIPFVVHAPHYKDGVNLADKKSRKTNKELFAEAARFADALQARWIIVHAGTGGEIGETCEQIKMLDDRRIVVENKPFLSLYSKKACVGSTPDEISMIMNETGCGFCFDIGHAVSSANAHRQDWRVFLKEFLRLKPLLCHLNDGDKDGIYDQHSHFGQGTFEIREILLQIPHEVPITIETKKDSMFRLDDFVQDVNVLRSLEAART